jgi:hypothetical protein
MPENWPACIFSVRTSVTSIWTAAIDRRFERLGAPDADELH